MLYAPVSIVFQVFHQSLQQLLEDKYAITLSEVYLSTMAGYMLTLENPGELTEKQNMKHSSLQNF